MILLFLRWTGRCQGNPAGPTRMKEIGCCQPTRGMEPGPWHRFLCYSADSSGMRLAFVIYISADRNLLSIGVKKKWRNLDNSSSVTLQETPLRKVGRRHHPSNPLLSGPCVCADFLSENRRAGYGVFTGKSPIPEVLLLQSQRSSEREAGFQHQADTECFLGACSLEALSLGTDDGAPFHWGGPEAAGWCLA